MTVLLSGFHISLTLFVRLRIWLDLNPTLPSQKQHIADEYLQRTQKKRKKREIANVKREQQIYTI